MPRIFYWLLCVVAASTLLGCYAPLIREPLSDIEVLRALRLSQLPAEQAYPVVQNLAEPSSLRPCCAFGMDLETTFLDVPVPLYRIDNVVSAPTLGEHFYNGDTFGVAGALLGLSREHNGLMYTRRGGFLDSAHIRDTADNTLFLFSQIYPRLGAAMTLSLSPELASRQIVLRAFPAPTATADRYALAAHLAAQLAYQLAQWHEIAQWYGYRSIALVSEEVSAFSPEDLYSNLLGAKLALAVLLQGNAPNQHSYNLAIEAALQQALNVLQVEDHAGSRAQLADIDGQWWDSQQRLPAKQLVRRRDYSLSAQRMPNLPVSTVDRGWYLQLGDEWQGYRLSALAHLQLRPNSDTPALMRRIQPAAVWLSADFSVFSQYAEQYDRKQMGFSSLNQ
ncbi:MAG: DUF4056 domain-containing protein [Plesiomonas sp.]|uniref:DUF4056 domain-containing protein n=1 Tax=Plesiomonas sp. TaxID=2486279 RepID=UPI003F2FE593